LLKNNLYVANIVKNNICFSKTAINNYCQLNIVINKSILFQELPSTIFDVLLIGSNESYLVFIVK